MYVADYLKQDLYFYENSMNTNYEQLLRGVSEGKMVRYSIKKKEPLLAEIEHFINCVENKKEPLVTGEDGLIALKVAHDLIKSSKKGTVI